MLRLFKPLEEDLPIIFTEENEAEDNEQCTFLNIQTMLDLVKEPLTATENEEPVTVSTLSPQDDEIKEIITDLRDLRFANQIGMEDSNFHFLVEAETTDFSEDHYDLSTGDQPIKDLIIELGTIIIIENLTRIQYDFLIIRY